MEATTNNFEVIIMSNELPELIDVIELQKYFKCSRDAAYRLMRRKDFPSLKIAGKHYCIIGKLPDWIERQCKKASK